MPLSFLNYFKKNGGVDNLGGAKLPLRQPSTGDGENVPKLPIQISKSSDTGDDKNEDSSSRNKSTLDDGHADADDINFVAETEPQHPQPQESLPSTSSKRKSCTESAVAEPSKKKKIEQQTKNPKKVPPKVRISTIKRWSFENIGFEADAESIFVTKIWCTICRKYPGAGLDDRTRSLNDCQAYVDGTDKVKKDSIAKHMSSNVHLAAEKLEKKDSQPHTPFHKRPIVKAVSQMDKRTTEKLCKLYDIAYTIAYNEMPFTKMPVLIKLERKHGVDLGTTYCNNQACHSFIMEINEHLTKTGIKSNLSNLHDDPFYYSLSFDGSSDKACNEKEITTIRYVNSKGQLRNDLLSIVHLQEANAETIHTSLISSCDRTKLPEISKGCVSASADGASVNFGKITGVMTLLKNDAPWLVDIHCLPHKFELALKDTFKGSYFESTIDPMLNKMYAIYHRSPKRLRNLRQIGIRNKVVVVRPPRASGTRWISHRLKALKALENNYTCIIRHLTKLSSKTGKDSAKMKGYLKTMKTEKFVLSIAAYRDILEKLSKFSLAMQSVTKSVTEVQLDIESVIAEVKNLKPNLGGCFDLADKSWKATIHGAIFKGVEVCTKRNDSVKTNILKDCSALFAKFEKVINQRFTGFIKSDIIRAMKILDSANWNKKDIDQYGIEELTVLTEHFGPVMSKNGCNLEELSGEWLKLKRDVVANHFELKFYELWETIISRKRERYRNMVHLIKIVLAIPVSSAHVERLFSTVKRTLGDWRLSLSVKTVEALVRISTEGPDPDDFDPQPVVEQWRLSGCRVRRPHTKLPTRPRRRRRQRPKPSETNVNVNVNDSSSSINFHLDSDTDAEMRSESGISESDQNESDLSESADQTETEYDPDQSESDQNESSAEPDDVDVDLDVGEREGDVNASSTEDDRMPILSKMMLMYDV